VLPQGGAAAFVEKYNNAVNRFTQRTATS